MPSSAPVRFRVLDTFKRPVSATADSHEVRDVVEVAIRESRDRTVTLLFDPEHNLEERILSEQSMTEGRRFGFVVDHVEMFSVHSPAESFFCMASVCHVDSQFRALIRQEELRKMFGFGE